MGISPDGRAATVAAQSSIPAHPASWVNDAAAVDWFVDALAAVIARLRSQMAEVEKADLVTQDLLVQITAELEKHRWMFQAERGRPSTPERSLSPAPRPPDRGHGVPMRGRPG